MFHLERLKQFFGLRKSVSWNLKETFSAVTELFFDSAQEEQIKVYQRAFLSLAYPLLTRDGRLNNDCKTVFRSLLEEYFNQQTAENHLATLNNMEVLDADSAAAVLLRAEPEKAVKTAEFLIVLAVALGTRSEDIIFVRKISRQLGMSQEEFSAFLRKITEAERKKQRLRNSSRGVIATLIIIAIFFLTAKYLQSVIFGFLLACILFPLEKFYERRISCGKGVIFWGLKIFSLPILPLKKLAEILSRKGEELSPQATEKQQRQKVIRQAVTLSCVTVLLIAGAAGFGISKLTGHYMKNLQKSIRVWEQRQINSLKNEPEAPVSKYSIALSQLKENLDSVPLLQHGLEYLEKMIHNPEFRDQITRRILRTSGGIVNFTGTVIGGIISLLCDLLLTVFFALLFLFKFAEFTNSGKGNHSGSEYIVRMFFNGIWLPGADESVIQETCKIIQGIFFRFRVWLKGYLTLILVDSTVYTTCFFFLGVPFFFPLGLLAGCGIALPYLGPVISCLTTLLVTIAAGSASAEMLIAIIVCYLIYNGIVEQFILYPAVIGESLGLSTLETIIVVLLGAIFAGIPGMIFALPTASIAKYLIPQIYHGFSVKVPAVTTGQSRP